MNFSWSLGLKVRGSTYLRVNRAGIPKNIQKIPTAKRFYWPFHQERTDLFLFQFTRQITRIINWSENYNFTAIIMTLLLAKLTFCFNKDSYPI